MAKTSAGILMYRKTNNSHDLEVFLVHSGGPYWTKKDKNAWGIPKGEVNESEPLETGAKREFFEETGISLLNDAALLALGSIRQKSGKTVYAWAWEAKNGEDFIKSIDFEIEWPPRSGKMKTFPEVDQARFFSLAEAREKMIGGQYILIERLLDKIKG
jgi:predicted NUDIX family NTP pyrophosphohydrolase